MRVVTVGSRFIMKNYTGKVKEVCIRIVLKKETGHDHERRRILLDCIWFFAPIYVFFFLPSSPVSCKFKK